VDAGPQPLRVPPPHWFLLQVLNAAQAARPALRRLLAGGNGDCNNYFCFSGDGIVQVQGRGDTRIFDLQTGDRVLTASGECSGWACNSPHWHWLMFPCPLKLKLGD
jgi:hypothetical protein